MSDLATLEKSILDQIAAAGDEAALEAVRVASLGKKGSISALLATLGKMSPDERKTVPGKRNVAILEVNPTGNYAVRLVFDDMHSTGCAARSWRAGCANCG